MGIFRKSLRICATLLIGVLWSVSSQAYWLGNIGRAVLRPASTSHQWQLAELNIHLQREAYGAPFHYSWLLQEDLSTAPNSNRYVFLRGQDKSYGSIYIGSATSGLELFVAPYQDQFKRFKREANDSYRPHNQKGPQEYLGAAPNLIRYASLLNHEKSHGVIYQPRRLGNNRVGEGRQDETDILLRKVKRDIEEEATILIIGCLAEHRDNEQPVDKDFVPNAIQECNDKEVVSKQDIKGKDYFDKSATGYRPARNSSPCFANGRDAVILNVPIWEREFYNSPSKWKKVQSKSALLPISRNLLASGLPVPSGRRDFSSQGSAPGISGFGTTASTYRQPSIQHYFDIGQSKAASFGFEDEAIGQAHKLSDCLALWEIKYRHNASIRKLKDSVIKDARKGRFAGATIHSGSLSD